MREIFLLAFRVDLSSTPLLIIKHLFTYMQMHVHSHVKLENPKIITKKIDLIIVYIQIQKKNDVAKKWWILMS
jgi:predicted nucleic acid binding AN1-type Zn finger protein